MSFATDGATKTFQIRQMYAIMIVDKFRWERFTTGGTLLPFLLMFGHVSEQRCHCPETFSTNGTHKRTLVRVEALVFIQMADLGERPPTLATSERFLAGVRACVFC